MEDISDLMEPLLQQADIDSIAIPFSPNMALPTTIYGTPTFSISPVFGASPDTLYEHPGGAEVFFLNLNANSVFNKVQCRRGGHTRMRVSNGVVEMVCRTPVQIMCIKTFVSREEKAAILHGDDNGRVELPVMMGTMDVEENPGFYKQFFSVDLDAVYDGPNKPIYGLSKIETDIRNLFQLYIQVQYIGGLGYQEFKSIPFLIKTKPRTRRLEDESTAGLHSPDVSRSRQEEEPQEMESPLYDSFSSNSGDSRYTEFDRVRILDHLEAKRASIDHLSFRVMTSPTNADIGYRFALKDPDAWDDFEEGDVVGFFKGPKDETVIDLLDNNNVKDASIAGVISRSAYLEAKQGLEKGDSDVVCVIGIVKVKCLGPIRAGERVYSSFNLDKPGTAMAESQLPPGAMVTKRGTLLGMAMEEAKKGDQERLVKCFVCIVLGIVDQKVAMEIENLYDHFNIQMTMRLRKERKRARRALCVMFSVLGILLIGLAALAFQLFYPGSALRVHFCKIGSIEDHDSTFKYFPLQTVRTFVVHGVEFPSWPDLQRKLHPQLNGLPPMNATKINTTKVHYYLNLDRCSYGGWKLATVLYLDPSKEVGGPIIYAIDNECSKVYYYTDAFPEGWRREENVNYYPEQFRCNPQNSFKQRPTRKGNI